MKAQERLRHRSEERRKKAPIFVQGSRLTEGEMTEGFPYLLKVLGFAKLLSFFFACDREKSLHGSQKKVERRQCSRSI